MQCLLFIFIKSKQSMNFSLCAPKWLDHLSQKFLRMKTLWLRTITTNVLFLLHSNSSNSSSYTFWSSKLASRSRSNWTGIWSETVTQMAVELINNISFQCNKRDECKSYILFHVKTTTNFEMMLNCCWNLAELDICKWWTD